MLKKLYDKSKITFAIVWIVAYCVLMSVGDALSAAIGVEKSVTLPIAAILAAVLLVFLMKNSLAADHGLKFVKASPKITLCYIPLIAMFSVNLLHGVAVKLGIVESILYIFTMLLVGFLEEVIFRGLLFNAMRQDNERAAIIVSALTFGIGHIINLVNGSGAELVPNLLQMMYATVAGFMFVMIYLSTDSLIVCILAHGIFNALSVISAEPTSLLGMIATSVLLTMVTGSYAVYLAINKKSS